MLRHSLIALLLLSLTTICRASDPIVVHEWGTFTSLQDERGAALGRINTDDESVPAFVHQIPAAALFPPTAAYTALALAKGCPAGDPNVTMRLETPVLYFHIPKNQTAPITLNVDVSFRGGWLTQYFPDAQATIPDATAANPLPKLTSDTLGKLSWHALTLNSKQGALPQTTDHVWTAPRAVDSTPVTAGEERERFLFYRGVGHLDAPIRVIRGSKNLEIQSAAVTIAELWLVDIRPDGALAFRALPQVRPNAAAVTPADFTPQDYNRDNLPALRTALHSALVAHGLFDDEANALLNTWERSYFQNPGQRLFFMVPQSWTNAVLPLALSVPAKVTRVMVGRIELITPAQRALLHDMAQVSAPDAAAIGVVTAAMTKLRNDPAKSAAYNALAGGHGNLADLAVPVPPIYADFLALGRFRTALVLDSKDPTLTAFASLLTP